MDTRRSTARGPVRALAEHAESHSQAPPAESADDAALLPECSSSYQHHLHLHDSASIWNHPTNNRRSNSPSSSLAVLTADDTSIHHTTYTDDDTPDERDSQQADSERDFTSILPPTNSYREEYITDSDWDRSSSDSSIVDLGLEIEDPARAWAQETHRSRGRIPSDPLTMDQGEDYEHDDWQQAGHNADAQDLAGPGAHGRLECTVTKPQKENEGTQNVFVSYLVTTDTDFKSFQSSHSEVRRRFTDFVFLYKTLCKEYPQCAVPPLPDKHKMEYVRGDRFGPDFTSRRAHSLRRFLKRLTLHPVLRRATLLALFLESSDWNAVMKSRPNRGMSTSEGSSTIDGWTDSVMNAFTKPHKEDQQFSETRSKARKLDDDLSTVSKTVARVARRESDLETDYAELATQFQKLAQLEPGVQGELTSFASSIETMGQGWKAIREHTDQDYLGSLRDLEAYITSIKALLKTRESKQIDFESLSNTLQAKANERDALASNTGMGASGFIRAKIEDVRGVDHEASRKERIRGLEVQLQRLTIEVESARRTSEAFDKEVINETKDFERIKAVEFKDTLGGLADAQCSFFKSTIDTWEKFIQDMEREVETTA